MANDNMNTGTLSVNELNILRSNNLITLNEIAFRYGDLYVAEDVVTKERRVLQSASLVLNEGRRVLNG
jgi:hypothetical protein